MSLEYAFINERNMIRQQVVNRYFVLRIEEFIRLNKLFLNINKVIDDFMEETFLRFRSYPNIETIRIAQSKLGNYKMNRRINK